MKLVFYREILGLKKIREAVYIGVFKDFKQWFGDESQRRRKVDRMEIICILSLIVNSRCTCVKTQIVECNCPLRQARAAQSDR